MKENESRTPSRFLACVTERMKLALTEMEETTGQGEKITRCLVLNVLIFFCLLDIEVEKLDRQLTIYNKVFSDEEAWLRVINWEIVSL